MWVVAAALLVGLGWALVAAIAGGLLIVRAGRPRLAGFVAVGLLAAIAAVVIAIVLREHPLPNAAWPVRFERWHGVGLFAAVSLRGSQRAVEAEAAARCRGVTSLAAVAASSTDDFAARRQDFDFVIRGADGLRAVGDHQVAVFLFELG